MYLYSITFYIFSLVAVLSAFMVISARNPVHSVLFLILSFVNASGLFVLLGAEFLAMILVVVYVGAVAVLFLFVVMMLNVAQQKNQWFEASSGYSHMPIGLIIGIVIFFELIIVVGGWKHKPELSTKIINIDPNITNTHSIGNVLYTEYIHLFQLSGMILLVAMIGAIVLTFRKRSGIKRQSYIRQISREKLEGVSLVDVEKNKGVIIDD